MPCEWCLVLLTCVLHQVSEHMLDRENLDFPVLLTLSGLPQVIQLYGLQKGFFDQCTPANVQASLETIVESLKQTNPDALERIKRTHSLGPMAEAVLKAALEETCKRRSEAVSVPAT